MTRFLKNWWLDYTFKHLTGHNERNPVVIKDLTVVCFGTHQTGQLDSSSFTVEFQEWKDTVHGKCFFRLWRDTAYFSREEDAMSFKLRFG